MSGSAKAGTTAKRHACELRVPPEFAVRAPQENFFLLCNYTNVVQMFISLRLCISQVSTELNSELIIPSCQIS
jgi:hypothetical protein